MKKIALITLAVLMIFGPMLLIATPDAYAQIDPGRTPDSVPVERAIQVIFNTGFWLLLMIAIIFFLLGAYYFLTAGQNPDNAGKGKSILTYAIIAIIVAILARGLAEFIPRMFGITP